jgi:methionyl-tRNA synthetase
MTRDLSWGIPVPLDDPDAAGKVLYVWFDAPIGYISFTAACCAQQAGEWAAYEQWWADPETAIVHFIGEDNTVFHALTWPAMLMAEGQYQLPHAVVANNFMNLKVAGETAKISKSSTAADAPVWVEEYLKQGLDPDRLRFYLTRAAPESARTAYDPAEFVARNDSELADTLGNFVNRALSFGVRFFDGRVPDAAAQTDADRRHLARAAAALAKVGTCLGECRFRAGLEELLAFAGACNEYVNTRAPWSSRKDNLPDCAAAIATCIHAIHYLAIMAHPFMPGAARKMLTMLNVPEAPIRWQPPPSPVVGAALGTPQILFAKLEPGAPPP